MGKRPAGVEAQPPVRATPRRRDLLGLVDHERPHAAVLQGQGGRRLRRVARRSRRPGARPCADHNAARPPSGPARSFGVVIAKVEPLTPARSPRGPFDYRLAGVLEDVGVGSMLVVPFGRRRLLGVVVDVADESELPPERLAEPIAALEADVPQSLVALGLWVAGEYVSTPARGLALVLPPGTGTGAGRPLRPKRSLRAAITPAGEAALAEGARMGARQRAALAALAGAPLGAAALARRTGCSHSTLRSLERRGPLRGALRRAGGGNALSPLPARALRRVVADEAWRGARLRGPALGGLRAVR